MVRQRSQYHVAYADAKLLTAAEFMRQLLGPGYHDRITDGTSVPPEQFHTLVERNDDLCRSLGLQYLWSVLLVDGRLVFTSATHSDLTNPDSRCAAFFEEHRDPQAFAAAMPPASAPSFSTFRNQWGEGRMVLVPGQDAQGRTYILGASLQLAELSATRRRTVLAAAAVGLGIIGGALLLALAMARSFTAPIARLTRIADRMATGDLEVVLPSAGARELRSLSGSLDRMRQDLRGQIAALRESEGKLSALFSSMTEMVALHELILDERGQPVNYRITDCNRAFTEITGIRREAAVGRLATEVYGTDKPPYLEEFSRVAVTGEPYLLETYFPSLEKHLSISVVSPGTNRFATVTTDVTAVKRAEQLLCAQNRELEQILYGASHDLRSPLVNVDGYGRELERSLGVVADALESCPASPETVAAAVQAALPEMTDALRFIRSSTKQMGSLINGLLRLSRTGRAPFEICPLDMNQLAAGVVASFDFQARKAGAETRLGDLPPCKGDEVQVSQVLANLVSNALKFLDPRRPGVITVSGVQENGLSVYCVEDNGIGVAPEHQEKIFELFYRLEPSRCEGEGLGLTMVRQVLDRMNGEIKVYSKAGEGSRFEVTLPAAQVRRAA
jgi:signal transduction histidine kinase/HAMP domain-containing protein